MVRRSSSSLGLSLPLLLPPSESHQGRSSLSRCAADAANAAAAAAAAATAVLWPQLTQWETDLPLIMPHFTHTDFLRLRLFRGTPAVPTLWLRRSVVAAFRVSNAEVELAAAAAVAMVQWRRWPPNAWCDVKSVRPQTSQRQRGCSSPSVSSASASHSRSAVASTSGRGGVSGEDDLSAWWPTPREAPSGPLSGPDLRAARRRGRCPA